MLGKMARATFLLMLTMMVVAWALSLSKNDAPQPQNDLPDEPWSIYS
jgi:hypothetical protein